MYRIINNADGSTIGLTEEPLYIKVGKSGSYTPADAQDAEGIACNSTPYSLLGHDPLPGAEGTVIIKEFDSGKLLEQLEEQEEIIDDILVLWSEEDASDKIAAKYEELYAEGKVTEDGLKKVMGEDKAEDIIGTVDGTTNDDDDTTNDDDGNTSAGGGIVAGDEAEVSP